MTQPSAVRLETCLTPDDVRYCDELLALEGRWFQFREPALWTEAQGPDQWNWIAWCGYDRVGWGRLVSGPAGVLIAHYAVTPRRRRQGIGAAILLELHARAAGLGCGLVACVYADNEPSCALAGRYFGGELYRGRADGLEVVVFGDPIARERLAV